MVSVLGHQRGQLGEPEARQRGSPTMGPALILMPRRALGTIPGRDRQHPHARGQPGGDARLAVLDHQA